MLSRLWLLCFLSATALHAQTNADGDIPLDTPWKKQVYQFTAEKLVHTAWGLNHSRRDYLLAGQLADDDGLTVDRDVLFAAAFLHDMGGFDPYQMSGVDHALRSTQVVEGILKPTGFPMEKLEAVKAAILTHSYYDTTLPKTPEAIVLHDADTLDFMGAIGFTRIVSLTQRESLAPDLAKAVAVVKQLAVAAPKTLHGVTAKKMGVERAAESEALLKALTLESYNLKSL